MVSTVRLHTRKVTHLDIRGYSLLVQRSDSGSTYSLECRMLKYLQNSICTLRLDWVSLKFLCITFWTWRESKFSFRWKAVRAFLLLHMHWLELSEYQRGYRYVDYHEDSALSLLCPVGTVGYGWYGSTAISLVLIMRDEWGIKHILLTPLPVLFMFWQRWSQLATAYDWQTGNCRFFLDHSNEFYFRLTPWSKAKVTVSRATIVD